MNDIIQLLINYEYNYGHIIANKFYTIIKNNIYYQNTQNNITNIFKINMQSNTLKITNVTKCNTKPGILFIRQISQTKIFCVEYNNKSLYFIYDTYNNKKKDVTLIFQNKYNIHLMIPNLICSCFTIVNEFDKFIITKYNTKKNKLTDIYKTNSNKTQIYLNNDENINFILENNELKVSLNQK
jgi:hypothetical protein